MVEATHKFEAYYKQTVIPVVEGFAQGGVSRDELPRCLARAEGKLPRGGDLEGFQRAFSRFVSLGEMFAEIPAATEDTLMRVQFVGLANKAWALFVELSRSETSEESAEAALEQFVEGLGRFEEKLDCFHIPVSVA